jgi:hypothetical protein
LPQQEAGNHEYNGWEKVMAGQAVHEEIYTEVLAESPDSQETLKRCRPAERLTLQLAPDNQSEGKVVTIVRDSGERIGYLEQGVGDKIAPESETGPCVEAMVLLVTDGGLSSKHLRPGRLFSKRTRHCYIKITT